MSPTPVKRDSSATISRHSSLAIPAIPLFNSRPSDPAPVDFTSDAEYRTLTQMSKVFSKRLSHVERAQAFYTIFTTLAEQLESTSEFPAVMSRIADDLLEREFIPPAQPCTLSHEPVTVTVTKEIHPITCTTEMENLRKEISDLKSGISFLYHSANLTHTAESSNASPSPHGFDSLPESTCDSNDSLYESSVSSTPKAGPKPLSTKTSPPPPKTPFPKSYANAAKTVVTKSPQEIIRDRTAKSCTNKGTPLNILILSGFESANTASSYKRIAEMRQKVNDVLIDNKCKSISWSSRGNLVTKCTKSLSDRDKTDITNSAKAIFKNEPTVLNKSTISYVKFIDVPLFDNEGTPFDKDDFNAMIQQNDKWANITHGLNVIAKKASDSAPTKATIKINFIDDKNSATARKLLKTTILFGGIPIRCKPWTSVPPVRRQTASNASVTEVSSSPV
ncbi:hypothetical protein M378DRAFT_18119 [Amanita muscaria Koide BX008]|uniref:Uncharacterized protein n=1 Tax=Amanita muscaria (strain Koide BX008) TaxID=946122 RepID=A0A0C2W2C0_AMAMK|nr:hypothetical protein M378DRAFT_18119 [Amanita muscaria Koide BX008]